MSRENVETIRAGFEAFASAARIDAFLEGADPEIEMHMRGVAGEPVHYSGHDGIRDYFRDMAESWQQIEWELEEVHDLGERVYAVAQQRLRGRASGIDVAITVGLLLEFRDGLVVEMRASYDLDEMRRAAGL